jgi:hypothetical protein
MNCRHNLEHVGCPSCREWRQQRDRKVAEQQHARFDTANYERGGGLRGKSALALDIARNVADAIRVCSDT